jgi:hypothetical protein
MNEPWMTPSGWFFNIKWRTLEYFEQKFYETKNDMLNDRDRKPDITIPYGAFMELQDWWDGEGKNRVSSARKEDLKIINKLLEIVHDGVKLSD